eukprot:Skav227821  [mRNA]  locus=scaffold948:273933:277061:+ [translate_table: standard]
MESRFARENLSLSTMDKVSLFSIGHGQMTERSFYELLQLNSIRVLYDLRASDHRGDVRAPCEHFSVRALKSSCRMRGIAYKNVALGRESAYGILKHIKTDEDRVQEEERLRKLEKQRQAGELHRPEKSAVDRSSEVPWEVPSSPPGQGGTWIDAMDELRAASNQVELERVQRNLARLQRLGDKHGAHKVVKAAPQWVLDEARALSKSMASAEQAERIAQKKAEKAEKAEAKSAEAPEPSEPAMADAESLVVECATCSVQFPWKDLAEGPWCWEIPTWCRWNPFEVKPTGLVVILRLRTMGTELQKGVVVTFCC